MPLRVKQTDDPRVQQVLDAVDVEDLDELRGRFAEAMEGEALEAMEDLDDAFGGGVLNEIVEEKVAERFDWVLPEIAETTRDGIESEIISGLDDGRNPRQVAQDIRRQFDEDYATWRAERIARTEMLVASNSGTWNAHRESSVVKFRSWLSTRDGSVRPIHRMLDNQTSQNPIPVNQPFRADGFSAMHPGDFGIARLDIHCRCTTVAEFDGEQRSRAERERIWKGFAKRLDAQESRTEDLVQRLFARQRDKVLAAFADAFDVNLEVAA